MQVSVRHALEVEAKLLSDLALRSKAVWGYSELFLERCRPLLTVGSEYIRSHPVFVAEVDNALAGFCSLREHGSDVEVDLLFVDPPFIGRGVGRVLLTHALQVATDMGYGRAVVESDPYAEAFYVGLGGRRVGMVASTVDEGRELPLLEFRLPVVEIAAARNRLVR